MKQDKNLSSHKKKNQIVIWGFVIISTIIIISFIFQTASIFFFNSKLNKINNELKTHIYNKNNELELNIVNHFDESLRLYESNLEENVSRVEYKFPNSVATSINIYDPTNKYFTWREVYELSNHVDSSGVKLLYREEINDDAYHPVHIAQYGLNQFGNYCETNDPKYLEIACTQADFFVDSIDKDTGLWYYDFDFEVGGTNETLKSPWFSAMAQGQAISLLSRISHETKDPKYLDTCQLAMKPFYVTVADGGLMRDFFGHVYLEEYPTILPNYALNGFLFTLIGIFDYWQISEDVQAKNLYNKLINTVEYCLPYYDSDGISFYHLGHLNFNEQLAPLYSTYYHLVHVEQLRVINQFERSPVIQFYINRWTSFVND